MNLKNAEGDLIDGVPETVSFSSTNENFLPPLLDSTKTEDKRDPPPSPSPSFSIHEVHFFFSQFNFKKLLQ